VNFIDKVKDYEKGEEYKEKEEEKGWGDQG
jgi:hypothetical protein